jgi:hypothetical protein
VAISSVAELLSGDVLSGLLDLSLSGSEFVFESVGSEGLSGTAHEGSHGHKTDS